jgi:hypothetical protein
MEQLPSYKSDCNESSSVMSVKLLTYRVTQNLTPEFSRFTSFDSIGILCAMAHGKICGIARAGRQTLICQEIPGGSRKPPAIADDKGDRSGAHPIASQQRSNFELKRNL